MITPEQTQEIREYLLSKRLPIDILMEVEDHFVNQITELQQQDLGFSEALHQVQTTWLPDLKMVYDARYSLDDITQLVKNILRTQQNRMLKKSLGVGFCLTAFLFGIGSFLPANVFGVILFSLGGLFAALPIVRFVIHYKDFFLPKKYPKFQLSIFQNANALSWIFLSGTLGWLPRLQSLSESLYHHPAKTVALGIGVFIWFSFHWFCFLN